MSRSRGKQGRAATLTTQTSEKPTFPGVLVLLRTPATAKVVKKVLPDCRYPEAVDMRGKEVSDGKPPTRKTAPKCHGENGHTACAS